MKRILLAGIIAACLAGPAAAAERRYSVGDFDRVRIEGPYEVTLATGRPSTATANGSQQGLDRVTVEVQDRILHVRPNRSAWGGPPGPAGPVRVALTTRDLRTATIIGSGALNIDKARGLRIDLSVSGSGRLALAAVEADMLIVGLSGAGKITLGGRAKQLRAAIQGTGDLDAGALRADGADIKADTSGAVRLIAVRTAKVLATGTGEVSIGGAPACTITGPSADRVRCGAP